MTIIKNDNYQNGVRTAYRDHCDVVSHNLSLHMNIFHKRSQYPQKYHFGVFHGVENNSLQLAGYEI